MIPAGTALEFTVTGRVSTWLPVESEPALIEASVVNSLMPFLTVKRVSVTPTSWALGGLREYSYQAHVAVQTKASHADAMDVSGWITRAFYGAAGQTPTVLLSNDPYAPAPPDPDAGDPLAFLRKLGTNVQTTVVMVAVAAIALVVLTRK